MILRNNHLHIQKLISHRQVSFKCLLKSNQGSIKKLMSQQILFTEMVRRQTGDF